MIEVTDAVTVAAGQDRNIVFTLHPDLSPELLTPGGVLAAAGNGAAANASTATPGDAAAGPASYRVMLPPGQNRFVLRYRGHIRHALQPAGEESLRGFRETPGTVTPAGVFLSGRSHWYPQLGDGLITFDLALRLPPGWSGMSQGQRVTQAPGTDAVHERWRCDSPQQEIYLVAGEFTAYSQAADNVEAMVILREPDAALAQRYLDATAEYLRLYGELIGTYPYSKFALVENFWETGYGMPSFTLLGPKVIRFPFILHSSYPHEILHNWWGNSVYVDYDSGNWAEGLTSYLADHLVREQRGEGSDYRRGTLQKYTDYVRQQQDFPLTQFRGRHSEVSEAVGYGKTLMLFHMLRRELGDERFIRGLRTLYERNRFRVTGFGAVEAAFAAVAGRPLGDFFTQWTAHAGAPQLRIAQARARPQDGGFRLSFLIEQVQGAAPFRLRLPLAVRLAGREQAWQTEVVVEDRQTQVELLLPARPLHVDLDPEFDVFRRLHREEIPPSIGQLMGAERLLIVLPDAAPAALGAAYAARARTWQAAQPERIEIVRDSELAHLPADRAVWLFGWRNRFRPALAEALADYDFTAQPRSVRVAGDVLARDDHAVVVLGRRAGQSGQALGWLAADRAAMLPGLGRKLPHYGRYSYLAFTGEAPDNVLKGQWPVVHSPLSAEVLQADSAAVTPGTARLSPRAPLVQPVPLPAVPRDGAHPQ
jgi:hypothetical protein